MEELVIRIIDKELSKELMQRAKLHHLSVDEEAKAILMRELVFIEQVRRDRDAQPPVTFDIVDAIREGRDREPLL
jgi:plasmid stability protein